MAFHDLFRPTWLHLAPLGHVFLCRLSCPRRFNTSLEKVEVKGDTLKGGHYVPC